MTPFERDAEHFAQQGFGVVDADPPHEIPEHHGGVAIEQDAEASRLTLRRRDHHGVRLELHQWIFAVPAHQFAIFVGIFSRGFSIGSRLWHAGEAHPTISELMMDNLNEPQPRWHGVSHLALVTPDMDATMRFYTGVLGMRLVATLMAGPMRHYFFEISEGNTVAFFEVPGMETFAKGAGAPGDRAIQLDHIAFDLPDEQALEDLRARLKAAHCEITDVVDHGIMRSVYFHDPNGIALEAACWIVDATARTNFDPEVFLDPDPVPAVAELRAGGLTRTPETHLA